MTSTGAKERYDGYWRERAIESARARSRARAVLAVELLEAHGLASCGGRVGQTDPPRLLDAGCGPGWALEVFAESGFRACGIDVSSEAVDRARARGLDVEPGDLESDEAPPFETRGGFDAITLLEVLEHLLDPLLALRRVTAWLAPRGGLVVSLPNEIHLVRRIEVLCGRLTFGGHDDPHVRHFDRRSAVHLFEAAGLRVLAGRGDPIVPPRRPLLRRLALPCARAFPGLFSLAQVYLLEPSDNER